MSDVAALAGVSAQTVSRVVNASPKVDPATRAKVEAALLESGYRVHRAARALRTGRSGTIGVVVATLATAGNSLMLDAVAQAAAARDHDIAMVTLGAGSADAAFDRLRDQGVDGVVVVNEAAAAARTAVFPAGLRFVLVDAPADERYAAVQTGHAGGAGIATEHLLALGHRTVAHIAGPATSYAAAERERGWRGALEAAGAIVPAPIRGAWSAASGAEAATALLERDPDLTAVLVANDQMALGVLRALDERGRRVPDDVSVVGFDDIADAADYRPPLTTLRQHFDRLAEAAVTALLDGGEPTTVVPATFVERASTARP
ncbi:LacI family DNA-binding transcriptional regulator [Microbacterium sp. GXF7504]